MPKYSQPGGMLNNHDASGSTDRSEYQGEAGPQYLRPDGTPRGLSVGERARLLRREGLRPGAVGTSRPGAYDNATNPDPGSVQLASGFRQD